MVILSFCLNPSTLMGCCESIWNRWCSWGLQFVLTVQLTKAMFWFCFVFCHLFVFIIKTVFSALCWLWLCIPLNIQREEHSRNVLYVLLKLDRNYAENDQNFSPCLKSWSWSCVLSKIMLITLIPLSNIKREISMLLLWLVNFLRRWIKSIM